MHTISLALLGRQNPKRARRSDNMPEADARAKVNQDPRVQRRWRRVHALLSTAAPASRAVCYPTALARALFLVTRLLFRRRRDARWVCWHHEQMCAFAEEG